MSTNPYEVLGLEPSATRDEIDATYLRLRDKYRLDMHSEGAKGREAARKLNEVETAYNDILMGFVPVSEPPPAPEAPRADDFIPEPPPVEPEPARTEPLREDYTSTSDYVPNFSSVENCIKLGRYDDAQNALDNISDRNAEWHFYQSAIYYKKGWLNESKSQLEIACSMDPSNSKYRTSLDKLNSRMSTYSGAGTTESGGRAYSGRSHTHRGYSRSYSDRYDSRSAEDGCCQACQAMICLNCLCDCCCNG